jgi:hypothetical protein
MLYCRALAIVWDKLLLMFMPEFRALLVVIGVDVQIRLVSEAC